MISSRHSQSNQQFEAALTAILPEIEQQLLKDIEQQLQGEFQEKFEREIEQINKQALEEYQLAVKQLQEARSTLQGQKKQQIFKQVGILEQALESIKQQRRIKLQQRFLQQNFQTHIMGHPRILRLQRQLQQQIYGLLQQKHEATKQRQLKELIIGHQTKEIKLRKQLDQQIKSQIYSSSGLQELKQQIKNSRVQLGSQKSQYNLKLKKVQNQISAYQQKISAIEVIGNLEELRDKYNQIQVETIQDQTQKELREKEEKGEEKEQQQLQFHQERNNNNYLFIRDQQDSLDENQDLQANNLRKTATRKEQSTQIGKTLKRETNTHKISMDVQFINNQLTSNDDQEDSRIENFLESQNNSKKFDLTAYFKSYLNNSPTVEVTQSQGIIDGQLSSKRTILNFSNIGDLLKQKVQKDPLQIYLNLNKENPSKENDMNNQNIKYRNGQKSSNFAELYEKHLRNLNKGTNSKTWDKPSFHLPSQNKGLSQMAKKTIIKNLSQYHKNTFHVQNQRQAENFAQPEIQNRKISYNTYESNLLASYK